MVKIDAISLTSILHAVSGKVLQGNDLEKDSVLVTEIGEPQEVSENGVAFVISESFVKNTHQTKAKILVVQSQIAERVLENLRGAKNEKTICISSENAYVGLARLTQKIASTEPLLDWPADAYDTAYIHSQAEVHPTAKVAHTALVGAGARIGARSVLLPGSVVGPAVQIGEDCILFPGTVVYPRTSIGNRVRLHANVVVGADGFGYAPGAAGVEKIWHLGRVVIQDDVEIGAGTTVDRGTLKDTVIEKSAKLDNLVQIGHNGHIKAHAILCAQVGIAGNVTVGSGAILAGKVGVADKIEIGDGALIGPMSGLSKDVKPKEQIMGQNPAKPRREWWRLMAFLERLPELFERVKKLEGKS